MRRTFVAENLTLRAIVCLAFNILDLQLRGGPSWASSERWDIVAKPEGEVSADAEGDGKLRIMAQSLLAERFCLTIHRELRDVTGYSLLVGRDGARLKAADPEKYSGDSVGNTLIRGARMSMGRLARLLSGLLGEIVVDQTRLSGDYDVNLSFTPLSLSPDEKEGGTSGADQQSLFSALRQLGLRLEHRRIPAEILVIESAERPDSN